MPPKIDSDKCDGVGACVRSCPKDVLELKDEGFGNLKAYVAHPENCIDCGRCVGECPVGAITLPYTLVKV
ncbi:MAG: 4Fe-4S dicluster domain-containing protein [Methanosarcinaceae archaeon]|jgi:NAD-dependent dihydropyrimidine dehydrogenase PreA subunit|nr:4Fe-4S dicluster domain-containing protein [Methanosarcinaceae archaeon]